MGYFDSNVEVVNLSELKSLSYLLDNIRDFKAFLGKVKGISKYKDYLDSYVIKYTKEKRKEKYRCKLNVETKKYEPCLDGEDEDDMTSIMTINIVKTKPTILFTFYTEKGAIYYDFEGDKIADNLYDLYHVKVK